MARGELDLFLKSVLPQSVHIVDGSLHVTNGGVNPVLTIMALAYRVSQHVADRRAVPVRAIKEAPR